MGIGERDWETEFFVGSAPTRAFVIKAMEMIKENPTLTENTRQSLLKTHEEWLKKIESITYDPIGDKPPLPTRSASLFESSSSLVEFFMELTRIFRNAKGLD